MELPIFANTIVGLRTLAEIEERHPELAAGLERFVTEIADVCERAYGRFAQILNEVAALEDSAASEKRSELKAKLAETYNHDWFKNVGKICAKLWALDAEFSEQINRLKDQNVTKPEEKNALFDLIHLLMEHERDIEYDIETAAGKVATLIGEANTSGGAGPARNGARSILDEIASHMRELRRTKERIVGSSRRGTRNLGLEAEQVLRKDPLAMVKLNMFFLVVVITLATGILRITPFWQFPLISGFALTALVIINAFHLRTSDKLSEVNFLELMRLALLKFFAPLTRRPGGPSNPAAPNLG